MVGGGTGDQVDHRRAGEERASAPVLGDKAKEPVLNLVPLARPRRKVTDMDGPLEVIGQLLQGHFPQPGATAIAPPAIGGNQQFPGLRVTLLRPCAPTTAGSTPRQIRPYRDQSPH